MPLFIRTNLDPAGQLVRVDGGFKAEDGRYYLLLHRLPPEYALHPTFLVRLSADTMEKRGEESGESYCKAYAIQDLGTSEKAFLRKQKPGATVVPFFNFSYPNVLRILGKRFISLTEAELKKVAGSRVWKLTPVHK